MLLNQKNVSKILNKNFNIPIVETCVGRALKFNALEAFIFANITGCGYLDNPAYPFSPKGTLKIFREAFKYNMVTGIFDKGSLLYAPSELRNRKPYLFSGEKYVLLKELTAETLLSEELHKIYFQLKKEYHDPENYLVYVIDTQKKGYGMEPFMEYIATECFKMRGYIVENQIPLAHSVGSPDFAGYKLKNQQSGFHIEELFLLCITKDFRLLNQFMIEHAIVGEAKTSTTIMANQLKKYLDTALFVKGYEIHPDKPQPSDNCFGLINISQDYSIAFKEPERQCIPNCSEKCSKYFNWYNNYLKFCILSNLGNKKLDRIKSEDFIEKIIKTDINTVADFVKGEL